MPGKIVQIQSFVDERGSLSVVEEASASCPFNIKRFFSISKCKTGEIRGNHANKLSKFLMIALSGSCKVCVFDTTEACDTFYLSSPTEALFLPEMTWKTMSDFSSDCVLAVLASEPYDAEEYITEWDEFIGSEKAKTILPKEKN